VVANARTIPSSRDANLHTVAGDISEPTTVGRIVDAALDRFGRIDTLVNSANVCIPRPFTDYTADYAAVTDVNLTGFFWLTQRVIGEMARRYGGHVVNIVSADDVPGVGLPAVLAALADGGVCAATRALAVEYAVATCSIQPIGRQSRISDADAALRAGLRSLCLMRPDPLHATWRATQCRGGPILRSGAAGSRDETDRPRWRTRRARPACRRSPGR
jgi:NAD(P)-dependent dehydrogenase (short-subunit alcohol dehydrogenase family)